MKTFFAALLLATAALAGSNPKVIQSPNGQTSVTEEAVICPTSNEKARSFYNQGTELEASEKMEEASKAYLQAIALDPKFCDAMDNLGLVYRRAGKLDEAISWYKKSIAVAPKNGTSRMNLAAALRMKKQLPESATEYAGLIKVLPKDPEGHYGLGSVYLDLGKAKEAVSPLLEAEKLYQAEQSPDVRDARVNIADAYYQLEQWPDAAKYFELIYPSSQEDPTTNLRFGTTLLKLKKQARARTILSKARDLGAVVPAEIAKQAGL